MAEPINFDIITCIYCGEPGRDRHHYKESVANSGQKRRYKVGHIYSLSSYMRYLRFSYIGFKPNLSGFSIRI